MFNFLNDGGVVPAKAVRQPQDADSTLFSSYYLAAINILGMEHPPTWAFSTAPPNAWYLVVEHRVEINTVFFRQAVTTYCIDDSCSDVVVLGLIAHELGHALNRTDLLSGSMTNYEAEFEADRVAGYVLARYGFASNDLERTINALSQVATPTHPHGHDRKEAIRWGYEKGLLAERWWLTGQQP